MTPALPSRLQTAYEALRPLIPDPWDERVFIPAIAAMRNRPLDLEFVPLPPGAHGRVESIGPRDRIVIDSSATGLRLACSICHEVVHLVLGHKRRLDVKPEAVLPSVSRAGLDLIASMLFVGDALSLPPLDPASSPYDEAIEVDAELLARALVLPVFPIQLNASVNVIVSPRSRIRPLIEEL